MAERVSALTGLALPVLLLARRIRAGAGKRCGRARAWRGLLAARAHAAPLEPSLAARTTSTRRSVGVPSVDPRAHRFSSPVGGPRPVHAGHPPGVTRHPAVRVAPPRISYGRHDHPATARMIFPTRTYTVIRSNRRSAVSQVGLASYSGARSTTRRCRPTDVARSKASASPRPTSLSATVRVASRRASEYGHTIEPYRSAKGGDRRDSVATRLAARSNDRTARAVALRRSTVGCIPGTRRPGGRSRRTCPNPHLSACYSGDMLSPGAAKQALRARCTEPMFLIATFPRFEGNAA